jgi:hypothetical protein
VLPNGTGWLDRFRLEACTANDFLIDRDAQRRMEDYTGIMGTLVQDQAVTTSMGAIYDRSSEHLGTSDSMIIQVRRRLLRAAQALEDHGLTPPAVDTPDVFLVRSGSAIIAENVNWEDAVRPLFGPQGANAQLVS